MRYLSTLLILCTSLSTAYALDITFPGTDYTCKILGQSAEAIVVEKGDANTLHVAVNHNGGCRLSEKSPLVLYWKMGKKGRSGTIPCEGLSSMEKNFFAINDSDVQYLDSNSFIVNFAQIEKIGANYEGNNHISNEVKFTLYKDSNGTCKAKGILHINGSDPQITKVEAKIKLLSLTELNFFSFGKRVLNLIKL